MATENNNKFFWWTYYYFRRHGVQLPSRSSASVPRGIVPTSRRCCITATSPIRNSTDPGRNASPAQLLWPTGFRVAGPSVWNSLPDSLRNPIIGGNSFRQFLKTFLFAMYWSIQHIRGFTTMRYINRLFTYLLTYLLTYLRDPLPRMDSKSLLHFHRHCRIGFFKGHLLAFLIQSSADLFYDMWLTLTIHNILGAIRQTSGSKSGV